MNMVNFFPQKGKKTTLHDFFYDLQCLAELNGLEITIQRQQPWIWSSFSQRSAIKWPYRPFVNPTEQVQQDGMMEKGSSNVEKVVTKGQLTLMRLLLQLSKDSTKKRELPYMHRCMHHEFWISTSMRLDSFWEVPSSMQISHCYFIDLVHLSWPYIYK